MSEPTAPKTFPELKLQGIVALIICFKDGDCAIGKTTNIEQRAGRDVVTFTWASVEERPAGLAPFVNSVRLRADSWTYLKVGNAAQFIRTAADNPELVPAHERPREDIARYVLAMDPNAGRL